MLVIVTTKHPDSFINLLFFELKKILNIMALKIQIFHLILIFFIYLINIPSHRVNLIAWLVYIVAISYDP